MSFNCTKCGACCKAINCPHLSKDNLCTIYETRPAMCRVDEGYNIFFKSQMTKEEYYKLNEEICSVLQKQESK